MTIVAIEHDLSRVNTTLLREQLAGAGATLIAISKPISWTKVDEQGRESIEIEPAKVTIDVSDDFDESGLIALIAAHAPELTDDEEHAAAAEEKVGESAQNLLELLLKSPQLKAALKGALGL